MIIDRVYVISEITRKKRAKTYLEIGVREGECFLRVDARRKIAVDPQIMISSKKKRKFIFRDVRNLFNRYLEITSDDFFKNAKNHLGGGKLDVVFIDGLHTYEQSLRDVENSLEYLSEGGVILMHDCNPQSEAAAHPASSTEEGEHQDIPGFTGEWNGDVWKTIVHLRASRPDLSIFVLDCDYGIGVVRKGRPEETVRCSTDEIRNMTYRDLDARREYLLNLKKREYLTEFLNTVR